MGDLTTAAARVLSDCLAVRPDEAVVVLTDPPRRSIAEALLAAARDIGAEAILIEMSERPTHGSEPPQTVAAAMLECDVFIAPTSKSVSHTEARRLATERGVRAATMPAVTEDMLIRTMSADHGEIERLSVALAQLLTEASEVRITSEAGSDLTLSIEGRDGIADTGDLRSPGAFGNLPAGEAFIAPVEGRSSGRLVVDGTIWPAGRLEEPITFEIEDGYATEIEGTGAGEFRAMVEPHGREALAVAELGIGTNPAATLTGNVLEDEKILGTIHVAFGDNHSFGGTIRVSSHQDGIILAPTVTLDGREILRKGSLLL